MSYCVTGASGFIGRRLVRNLLKRGEDPITIILRSGSAGKIDKLLAFWEVSADRIRVVHGDLAEERMGVSDADIAALKGSVTHFFHMAARYDLTAGAEEQIQANVDGTRHALDLAKAIEAGCFHHTSSIAAAGMYDGVFREDMFHEATGLEHPYLRSKHDSEGLVRAETGLPWRIYRPGAVVGDSKTGEMDKIDGPYYLFRLIQKVRRTLPPWMPTIGIEGGRMNIVPVDYVVDAMDHIAHQPGLDGTCFHLTDPEPLRIGELMNVLAKAGHAPPMTMRINTRMFGFIPSYVRKGIVGIPPIRRAINAVLKDLGIPRDFFAFVNYPTRFDNRETEAALEGSGISVPNIEEYAWRLWDYWERHLDPELFVDRSLAGRVKDRVAVVTGGSSGIGKATAIRLAAAGAKVILVARTEEKLVETQQEIQDAGGTAFFYPCDLTDLESCDNLVKSVLKDHGEVTVLVNNAGRSIRRSIGASFDRFHDFERTMQLNYFGSLRITMGFLPQMKLQRRGHVIHISSIGVLTNAPRFSAYVASKAAMDAFLRCAAAEFSGEGIHFTTINMPLVRTPMIAPTKMYDKVPAISTEEAAGMVADAIIYRPKRIATRLGTFIAVVYAVAPKITEILMNTAFRLFPDSSAAKGADGGKAAPQEVSPEQAAFAEIMRGIHW